MDGLYALKLCSVMIWRFEGWSGRVLSLAHLATTAPDLAILVWLANTNQHHAFAAALAQARPHIVQYELHQLHKALGSTKFMTAETLAAAMHQITRTAASDEVIDRGRAVHRLGNAGSLMCSYLLAYNDRGESEFGRRYERALRNLGATLGGLNPANGATERRETVLRSRQLGMLLGTIFAGAL